MNLKPTRNHRWLTFLRLFLSRKLWRHSALGSGEARGLIVVGCDVSDLLRLCCVRRLVDRLATATIDGVSTSFVELFIRLHPRTRVEVWGIDLLSLGTSNRCLLILEILDLADHDGRVVVVVLIEVNLCINILIDKETIVHRVFFVIIPSPRHKNCLGLLDGTHLLLAAHCYAEGCLWQIILWIFVLRRWPIGFTVPRCTTFRLVNVPQVKLLWFSLFLGSIVSALELLWGVSFSVRIQIRAQFCLFLSPSEANDFYCRLSFAAFFIVFTHLSD